MTVMKSGVVAAMRAFAAGTGSGQQRPIQPPPITLAPDDRAAFPPAPSGFDVRGDGIVRGRAELVEYESKTVGTRRKALVSTPPGYSPDRRYPVPYLLHGIDPSRRLP